MHSWRDDPELRAEGEQLREENAEGKRTANGSAEQLVEHVSIAAWLSCDVPEPDSLLGEVFSTTSRGMLVANTGTGKTNVAMAMAGHMAEGCDFLHWRGRGRQTRTLFIEGEMSRRLVKSRIMDMVRRLGRVPQTLYVVSRSDPAFEDMPPLNYPAGQRYVDNIIEQIGGADFTFFDNIQALTVGDMKEEESWGQLLPWIRGLTNREIGQLWIHHTGHNASRSYGTKTREWQLDTVMLAERAERPEADLAFSLSFPKAREKAPHNRADFEPTIITLTNDEWMSERGGGIGNKGTAKDRALELLRDAITRDGVIPPASQHIPPNVACVTEDLWFRYCEKGRISEGKADAVRMAFSRAAKAHLNAGMVGKWEEWVWLVK